MHLSTSSFKIFIYGLLFLLIGYTETPLVYLDNPLYLSKSGCWVFANSTSPLVLNESDFYFKFVYEGMDRAILKWNLNLYVPPKPQFTEYLPRYKSQLPMKIYAKVVYDNPKYAPDDVYAYLNNYEITASGGFEIEDSFHSYILKEDAYNKYLRINVDNDNWANKVNQVRIESFYLCLYNPTLKIHLTSQIPNKVSPGENITIEGYVENPSPVDASAKISLEGFSKYFNIFPSQPYNVEINNVRTQDNRARFKFILTLKNRLSPEDKLFIEQQNNQLKLGKIKVSYKNKYFSVPWTTMEKDLGKITFEEVSKPSKPKSEAPSQPEKQDEPKEPPIEQKLPIWVILVIAFLALLVVILFIAFLIK